MDTDALPSSSPSLIWLELGFGLAGAVTIEMKTVEMYAVAELLFKLSEALLKV